MKINEIISEAARGTLRKGARKAVPNLKSYPYLDNNNHPYLAYRFGMALASSPRDVDDKQGPIGSEFTTIGYSEADQEIIDHARKEFGFSAIKHSDSGSKELDGVKPVSPVATRKKNKYGV